MASVPLGRYGVWTLIGSSEEPLEPIHARSPEATSILGGYSS